MHTCREGLCLRDVPMIAPTSHQRSPAIARTRHARAKALPFPNTAWRPELVSACASRTQDLAEVARLPSPTCELDAASFQPTLPRAMHQPAFALRPRPCRCHRSPTSRLSRSRGYDLPWLEASSCTVSGRRRHIHGCHHPWAMRFRQQHPQTNLVGVATGLQWTPWSGALWVRCRNSQRPNGSCGLVGEHRGSCAKSGTRLTMPVDAASDQGLNAIAEESGPDA